MSKLFKRAVALFLSAAMLAGSAIGVGTIPNVGTVLRAKTTQIGDRLFYSSNTLQHNVQGVEEERFFSLGAGSSLKPVVVNGSYIYNSGLTIKEAADKLKAEGYTVVGGITGDMYTVSNGVPLGLVVRQGLLRACDNSLPAVGFTNSGKTIIGTPNMKITLEYKDGFGNIQTINIDKINRVREAGKIYLYTSDFAENTKTTLTGTHVAINTTDKLRINTIAGGTVKDVYKGKDAYNLNTSTMVLSASSAEQAVLLENLKSGMEVKISVTTEDKSWSDVNYASGGVNQLIKNGVANTGFKNERAPRTAVGVRADGSSVYYAVDGRQSGYSNGMSLSDVALRLKEMGCVQAIELDGGGSTAVGVTEPGQTEFKIDNQPSDGSLRKSASYIFFVNTSPKTHTPAHLHLKENSVNILPGGKYTLSVLGTDSNWHAVTVPSSLNSYAWASDDQNVGTVAGGVFTALSPGTASVMATYQESTGSSIMNVVSYVDSIEIYNKEMKISKISAAPGEIVNLTGRAMLNGFPVVSSAKSYVWSVIGSVGTISEDGVFTASAEQGGAGKILITAGNQMATIDVTIDAKSTLVEDFESSDDVFQAVGAGVSYKSTTDCVRGFSAGRIDYTFTEGDMFASLESDIDIPANAKHLSFHIKGTSPNGSVVIAFSDADGAVKSVAVNSISDSYQLRTIEIPGNSVKITGITIPSGEMQGSVYIDQIVAMWEYKNIAVPPVISISDPDKVTYAGYLLYDASVKDGIGGNLDKDGIRVMYDGKPINFTYNDKTGGVSVMVTEPANDLHMLTIEASDVFGNLARKTVQIKYERSASTDMLRDVSGWYEPYVDYLDLRGILNTTENFGLRYYQPGKNVGRVEMFEMIIKLSGVNPDDYRNVETPFTDMNLVDADKVNYIKAAYALGYLAGRSSGDGTLRIGVGEDIQKQDFCVIVSRLLPKGYKQAVITSPDSTSVQEYSKYAIGVMIEMGLLVGNEKGEIEPGKPLERSVACTILTRAFF